MEGKTNKSTSESKSKSKSKSQIADIAPLSEEQANTNPDSKSDISNMEEMTHAQTVRSIVNLIMSSKLRSYEKEKFFRKRFPNFAESMPKVFDMVVKDNLDDQSKVYIGMMLDMSERLLDKKDVEVIEADKVIFNKLREDYIDPIIKPDKAKVAEFMSRKEYTAEELNGGQQFNVDVKNQ